MCANQIKDLEMSQHKTCKVPTDNTCNPESRPATHTLHRGLMGNCSGRPSVKGTREGHTLLPEQDYTWLWVTHHPRLHNAALCLSVICGRQVTELGGWLLLAKIQPFFSLFVCFILEFIPACLVPDWHISVIVGGRAEWQRGEKL